MDELRSRKLHGGADDFLRHGERQVGRVPEADAALAAVEPAELAANPDYVESVLRDGAQRARATASQVLARARKACGLA